VNKISQDSDLPSYSKFERRKPHYVSKEKRFDNEVQKVIPKEMGYRSVGQL